MGYALFAQRKIALTAQVNALQLELDQVMQEKQNLLNYSSIIADGEVSDEELISNPGNFYDLLDARDNLFPGIVSQADSQEYLTQVLGSEEAPTLQNGATQEVIDAYLYKQYEAEKAVCANWVEKVYTKNLAAIENELDMKQKRIETKLTAMQKQLEAVEQAEGQAINNATPKYAGLG